MSAFRGQALCCTGQDRPTNNGDMPLHLASTRAGHGGILSALVRRSFLGGGGQIKRLLMPCVIF